MNAHDLSFRASREPVADEWAKAAASLPLAFSQVREDPRHDLEVASQLRPAPNIVVIASGGETAIQLGRSLAAQGIPGQLHLVDMNPAQLALTRLKWHLAEHCSSDESAALLGHLDLRAATRRPLLEEVLDQLGLDRQVFGPIDVVAEHGPDQCGRYERTFAELRRELQPVRDELWTVLRSENPAAASSATARETALGKTLDDAFATVMSLPNLVCLFGNEATRNPRRSFAEHFAWRTREVLRRLPASSNPFLWQIFAGRFPEGHRYDWLRSDAKRGRTSGLRPTYHDARMADVLCEMQEGSMDLVHLSNILDWLSPVEAEATLASASRVLRPGGRVILRQLNSTLDILGIRSELTWDIEWGKRMESTDRSFFYPGIFVGVRS